MKNLVDITELPHEYGVPIGRYLFRYSTLSQTLPGCVMVDGESVEPMTGRALLKLRMAYGASCEIEPWDEEAAILVADYLENCGKSARAIEVLDRAADQPEALREFVDHLDALPDDDDGLAEIRAIAEAAQVEGRDQKDRATLRTELILLARKEIARQAAEDETARKLEESEAEDAKQAAEKEAAEKEAETKKVAEAEQARLANELVAEQYDANEATQLAALEASKAVEKEAADAKAAEDQAAAAQAAEALQPVDPNARNEANVSGSVGPAIIDDDIDTIEDLDVLRAIAAGEGVDPGEMGAPALKAEIRKARGA